MEHNQIHESAETRNCRLNKELIDCFKKPAATITTSSRDQGIGFYTHVGPTTNPRLLPVGGRNGRRYQPKPDRNLPEEVIQVYEELTKAIQNEQKASVGAGMRELQRRYADAGANGRTEQRSLSRHQQQFGSETQALARNKPPTSRSNTDPGFAPTLVRSIGLDAEPQKAPTNSVNANDDRRRKSVMGGNIYDADRDPRRRGK